MSTKSSSSNNNSFNLLLTLAIAAAVVGTSMGDKAPKKQVRHLMGTGNCTIIITAPHGGQNDVTRRVRIPGCKMVSPGGKTVCEYGPDVDCTGITPGHADYCPINTVMADNTVYLTELLQLEMENELGCKPHVVQIKIKRKYIDVDDTRRSAAQKDVYIQRVHDIFHQKVRDIKASFGANRGIVFDFTMQSDESHTQFGYYLDYNRIKTAKAGNENGADRRHGSTYALFDDQTDNPLRLHDHLFGAGSIGSLLEAETNNFRALPSSTLPETATTEYVYNNYGGRILKYYGSRNARVPSTTDAIEVAVPQDKLVKCTEGEDLATCTFALYVKDLGMAMAKFYRANYWM